MVDFIFFSNDLNNYYFLVSRVEYRALEGFVLAVSPFNFTAIAGNLPGSMSLFFELTYAQS